MIPRPAALCKLSIYCGTEREDATRRDGVDSCRFQRQFPGRRNRRLCPFYNILQRKGRFWILVIEPVTSVRLAARH
jgi:hypothetical protein